MATVRLSKAIMSGWKYQKLKVRGPRIEVSTFLDIGGQNKEFPHEINWLSGVALFNACNIITYDLVQN